MSRKGAWPIAAAVFLGFLIVGLSQLWAQRFGDGAAPRNGDVGRYQVVRSTGDITIILDTVTGDLYNAVPSDIKPYRSRPANTRPRDFDLRDKEKRIYREKDFRKDDKDFRKDDKDFRKDDKDRFSKEKSDDKDRFSKEKSDDKDGDKKSDKFERKEK